MVVLEIDVHPGGRSHCCSFPQYGLYRESVKNNNGRFNGHTMAANNLPCLVALFYRNCEVDALSQWSCAISINYWQEGAAPRGMMFAQQVLTEKQDSNHDVYIMPESLFIRVACTAETAKAAFDKNSCELHELFGVIKDSLDENGYVLGTNGAQEIEIYNYEAGLFYAYVQVMRKEAHGA